MAVADGRWEDGHSQDLQILEVGGENVFENC